MIQEDDILTNEMIDKILRFNMTEDVFFQKVIEDRDACEEILQVIMQRRDIYVQEVHPQHFLRNLDARSVVLDAYCELEDGTMVNVEMQKRNDDDFQKRMRFNLSNMDTSKVEKNTPYAEMPDAVLILISEFDIFGKGNTTYHVERRIAETGDSVYNGVTEIYVNTVIDDKSEIADLMRYFRDTDVNNKQFSRIANRVEYLKIKKEGRKLMGSVTEEILEEGRVKGKAEGKIEGKAEEKAENISTLMKNMNWSLQEAFAALSVPKDEQEKYRKLLNA